MKKVLLTSLALSLLSSTALASSTPVTDIENGKSSVELNYSTKGTFESEGSDESVNTKNRFGFSLGTSLSDKWAVQYSYNKIHSKDYEKIIRQNDLPQFFKELKDDLHYPVSEDEEKAFTDAGETLKTPSNDNPDRIKTSLFLNADVHSLKGFYKVNENLNAYAGLDHVRFKSGITNTSIFSKDHTETDSNGKSEKSTGFSAGLVGHTKLSDNVSAFASVGVGNVIKYDMKLGLQYDVTKDLGLGVSYTKTKIKGIDLSAGTPLKYRGLSLAVNYKF